MYDTISSFGVIVPLYTFVVCSPDALVQMAFGVHSEYICAIDIEFKSIIFQMDVYFGEGTYYRRQNMTHVDVKFCGLKSIPAAERVECL